MVCCVYVIQGCGRSLGMVFCCVSSERAFLLHPFVD